MINPYAEYNDTPVWRAVAAALRDLEANQDVVLQTAPDYVIGFLCQQLAVRQLLAPVALSYDP
jgi:hypothetical protein